MRVGGQWVGWGLGDVDPKVRDMKGHLRRKFSYARHLADTDVYDQQMVDVVMEMQRRYALPVTGIMNAATQEACGYWKPIPPPRPTLYTVCGTGVPWWVGPDADIGKTLEGAGKYRWQPVGYPARPFPMWPSVMLGVAELARLVEATPGRFSLVGYSQGAIVVGQFYKHHLFQGALNHRLPDLVKYVTFGDPMRPNNTVWPDGVGRVCRPNTGGILEDRLDYPPTMYRTYGHAGDLYTDVELNDEGEHKRAIGKIVMGSNVFGGPDSILAQLVELGLNPFGEGMAAAQALMDAGMFFINRTTPHINYNPRPAIDYLMA